MPIRVRSKPPALPLGLGPRAFDVRGTLALLGSVICWAAMPIFLRQLRHDVDAWTANALRYSFAALLFVPALAAGRLSAALDGSLLRRALVPAFLSLAGQVFWGLSPYYLSASLIGFLVKVSIVWALLGSMILFREERALLGSRHFYGGLLLATTGFTTLAIGHGALEESITGQGVLIMLACTLFFGLYGVSVRRCLSGVRSPLAFGVVAVYVSMGTLPLMFIWGDAARVPALTAHVWWLIAVSSFLGIALSHVLYYAAIQRLGASIATGVHLLGPFVTMVLANVFLGESMGRLEWGAGAIMVAGAALLLLAQEKVIRAHPQAGEAL